MEDFISGILNLGAEKHRNGNLSEAEILYKKVLEKSPDNADALHLLGLVAQQKGNSEKAIKKIAKAIEIRPEALFYYNLAMIYDEIGDEKKSADNFLKMLEINPTHQNAYVANYNLGIYFNSLGFFEKAISHYENSIKLKPDFADAKWNLGLLFLLLGRFAEGWENYEFRLKKTSPTDSRNFSKPKWNGSPLNGKKILVISEQGFGDTIQFSRYLQMIKNLGGYLILEAKKEIIPLLKNTEGIDEIIEKGESISAKDFDFYIHLMSLPRIFKTDSSNIPNKIPYLFADKEKAEKFKHLFNSENFNIGIAWAGNPEQENDKNRSTTFEKFKTLKMPGIKLYSLQKGASEKLNDPDVVDLSEEINDFSDTAAIMENLDLIISVDTSVAHLAGALGKPCWVLLSFIPDWRWMLDRKDNLWYPGMKLFRQKKKEYWDLVFEEAANELKKKIINYAL